MQEVHVLKFGGTSLKDHAFIQQAINVVENRAETHRPVVIVSAVSNVTDQLVRLADEVSYQSEEADILIGKLQKEHTDLLKTFSHTSKEQHQQLETLFKELKWVYSDSDHRLRHPKAWRDHLLSFGERASALIFASALSPQRSGYAVESQHIIKTDANFGEANVIPDLTRKLVRDRLNKNGGIPVVTGFIGSTEHNEITTLGRSGSDYTAALITDALQAEHLEIWTDVDGVLTADPKIVPTAHHIDQLSFEDISELSAHKAKVIHPKTIRPIQDKDVSVQVRNSHNPEHPGTLIHRSFKSNGSFRSIIVSGPFTYFEIPDAYYQRFNQFLEKNKEINSDAEGVSYFRTSDYEPARFVIREELFNRIQNSVKTWADKNNVELSPISGLHTVKAFTNRLLQNDKPVEDILKMLSRKGIRPVHFQRSRQQRHATLLLPKEGAFTAARLINDYQIDHRQTVDLFIAGIGAVGNTLIQQLQTLQHDDIRLRVIGICDSKQVFWNKKGLELEKISVSSKTVTTDWASITDELISPQRYNTIFVDATGSTEVARLYPELMKAGIHIATPSKLGNTFEQAYYDQLQELSKNQDARYRYETTVGAGLPVISTINDLLNSGDAIHSISGVVSGTMTYLFNELEKGIPFSQAVIDAREKGYAEPDPRDDLSGEDVARKFLILARTLGHKIERDELEVETLVPEELLNVDRETFLNRISEFNGEWRERIESALKQNKVLRYTGSLKGDGTINIGIQSVPKDSPLGQLKGTDNLIQITSENYSNTPLIIQGPGAGKKVTAAGLLADVLKIAREIT